jgi:hypothetical protein
VDGNNHQIDRIKAEARKRKITIPIVVDFIHVLDELCSHCTLTFLRCSQGPVRSGVCP